MGARTPATRLAVVTMVWGLVACGDDDDEPPPVCEAECMLDDSRPFCVATTGCETAADCPAAAVCSPETRPTGDCLNARGTPGACAPDCARRPGSKSCRIPTFALEAGALLEGFGVTAFPKFRPVPDEEGAVSFEWAVPPGAGIVHCALFGCPPVIDGTPAEIANFDQCVLRHEVYEPAVGPFDLTDGLLECPQGGTRRPCRRARAGYSFAPRMVSMLAVGCWAYDGSALVAATPLLPIDEAGLPADIEATFDPACASDDSERANCRLASGAFGTCVSRVCRARCLDGRDCVRIGAFEAELQGIDAADAADLRCHGAGADAAFVGVCLPESAGD